MLLYPITVRGNRGNYNNNRIIMAIPGNPGIVYGVLSLVIPGLCREGRSHTADLSGRLGWPRPAA